MHCDICMFLISLAQIYYGETEIMYVVRYVNVPSVFILLSCVLINEGRILFRYPQLYLQLNVLTEPKIVYLSPFAVPVRFSFSTNMDIFPGALQTVDRQTRPRMLICSHVTHTKIPSRPGAQLRTYEARIPRYSNEPALGRSDLIKDPSLKTVICPSRW